MKKELSVPARKVISYMARNPQCFIVKRHNFGIPVYRILKGGDEKTYPKLNEDIYCEILHRLTQVGNYTTSDDAKYAMSQIITANQLN